ncbi:hypothetical protein PHLGIDRAFT_127213 [Phlebiopsis gigantea 11061_1 CR5-6]|uniref:FAD/NAD(P)-binding domain-containing protein n=1 Tax=Phlebiopsis gigantea (strain 11061_1 CR5-6) TaxID=745531 RepID=A0A0C3NSH7_PHLG1|nr:hypothetical protein PHLGIDRAFT_127213 [Phlebiopsis gigantea 11061_1 CR5-6]
MAALTSGDLQHAAKEVALLPLTLFTFFCYELPKRIWTFVLDLLYFLAQLPIIWAFKPPRPPKELKNNRGRIAIIGAGLTGVSSAAHAIAHGFDVAIYEKNDSVGGIWSSVNATSGLQLNSLLYRFHPAVKWSRFFPHRDEILGQIEEIWREYQLEARTHFKTPVTSVKRVSGGGGGEDWRSGSKWVINGGEDGEFDAVIVTIGTCGEPNMVQFPGMPGYKPKHEEKGQEQQHGNDKPQQDHTANGSLKTEPKESQPHDSKGKSAIQSNQQAKKAHGFPKPAEAYGDNKDKQGPGGSPTQDQSTDTNAWLSDKVGAVDGAVTTIARGEGAWDSVQEPTWQLGQDQVAKREQGFPRPDEAYDVGPDVQKDTRRPGSLEVKETNDSTASEQDGRGQEPENGGEEDVFRKPILHSSQLTSTGIDFKGKRVVVLGGGASAIESVETALSDGASSTVMVVRDDKWIIPRNSIIDTMISAQPFGREMPLSFLWEKFITKYNYHGVEDLTPADLGLFEGTPIVNDEFLNHVREGRCQYTRGDIQRLTANGVKVNVRTRNTKPGDEGRVQLFDADVVVIATGFKPPDMSFLPKELFPEGYDRPNLYLQNFSTEDWSILFTNSAYKNAIGTVGHFHIGIYARILMTFLMDENARPSPKDMKLWVDVIRFVKRGAKKGAFGFFTYMELTIWLLLFHLFRPDRIRWVFFIMQGWGVRPLK